MKRAGEARGECRCFRCRGTLRIRNTHPPRITIDPWASGYCRVLGEGGGVMSEVPL